MTTHTPKPIRIPRDLKCGDMLKLSTGDVAIVRNSHCSGMQSPYHSDGCITADPQNPIYRGRNVWNEDGTAWGGSRLWVVRIIRKTSKPAKRKGWAVVYWCKSREQARDVKDYLDRQCPKCDGSSIRRLNGEGKL